MEFIVGLDEVFPLLDDVGPFMTIDVNRLPHRANPEADFVDPAKDGTLGKPFVFGQLKPLTNPDANIGDCEDLFSLFPRIFFDERAKVALELFIIDGRWR